MNYDFQKCADCLSPMACRDRGICNVEYSVNMNHIRQNEEIRKQPHIAADTISQRAEQLGMPKRQLIKAMEADIAMLSAWARIARRKGKYRGQPEGYWQAKAADVQQRLDKGAA